MSSQLPFPPNPCNLDCRRLDRSLELLPKLLFIESQSFITSDTLWGQTLNAKSSSGSAFSATGINMLCFRLFCVASLASHILQTGDAQYTCSSFPFVSDTVCNRPALSFELAVIADPRGSGAADISSIVELLVSSTEWPINMTCGGRHRAIEAVFTHGGLIPSPDASIQELDLLFAASRAVAGRMLDANSQNWVGVASRDSLPWTALECTVSSFVDTPLERVLHALCPTSLDGPELLSVECPDLKGVARAPSSNAWRMEQVLLEAATSGGEGPSRSDMMMGVLLETQPRPPAARNDAGGDGGPRARDARARRSAFHARVLADIFPDSAGALLEADGTTLRSDLRIDAAYAPVLLEATVGHLARAVPALKWLLEPVMWVRLATVALFTSLSS